MKDSNITWLGNVPNGWNKIKLKKYYDFEKGKNASIYTKEYIGENIGDYPVYSGQTENDGIMGKINTYDYDLDECLFTTTVGAKVMTPKILKGKFSLSQNCLIMKKKQSINNNYMLYMLLTMFDYEKSMIPSYMQPSLRVDDLNTYICYIPEVSEQNKIAKFLEKKVNEIDKVIEKTKETIEDYKKYKNSIISENVTKGTNKNVEMKDSNIPWIGLIPKDWQVLKIKNVLEWKSIKNHGQEQVLSLYRDYGVIPKESRDDNHNVTSEDTNSYKFVEKGDFVINKMKAWQGSMAVSEYTGIISPAYHVCKFTNKNINKKYFHYLLRNQLYLPEFRRLSTGLRIGQWDLGFEDFKNLVFILPSDKEQMEIVVLLDKKCSEIDKLISNKEKIIEELEQYKKSLIYEYVTGKKEVV